MNILKYLKINTILICCFTSATETESVSYPIDVFVYNGQGSILISWSLPDSINASKTRLYFKKFSNENYELLSTLPSNDLEFLHVDCIVDQRYFYKIEIEDIFGDKYYSDIERPSFGTCLAIKDSSIFDSTIKSPFELVLQYINDQLNFNYPFTNFYLIEDLLKSTLKNNHNWIEKFPLHMITSINPTIDIINDFILDENLFNYIMNYEPLYRNHFLLSPYLWKINVKDAINMIKDNWNVLYNEYSQAIELFDDLEPIRILGCEKNGENISNLFHPEEIIFSDWYILSGDEYINLKNYNEINERLISVEIPRYWEYVDLMMNGNIIQNCPIIIDKSITYTLQGDIVPMDVDLGSYIKVEKDQSSLWLNEMIWNYHSKTINVELAGNVELHEKYLIKFQEKSLWEIESEPFGFERQFIDSSFVLGDSVTFPQLISLQTINGYNSTTIEYIILDTASFTISRMRNNGSWINTQLTTLGSTNEIVNDNYSSEFLPDIFVLYQNYPNPFNGQTRITFDLLEDAVVTLNITDATGRIHDRLIDKEYIKSGIYNFLWEGDGRSSGIYFITLQAEVDQTVTALYSRKMIYLK